VQGGSKRLRSREEKSIRGIVPWVGSENDPQLALEKTCQGAFWGPAPLQRQSSLQWERLLLPETREYACTTPEGSATAIIFLGKLIEQKKVHVNKKKSFKKEGFPRTVVEGFPF